MVAWAWGAAAVAVVLVVARARSEARQRGPAVWYLPDPPGFASLLRSVILARQAPANQIRVDASAGSAAECWRDCRDWYVRLRQRSVRAWIAALVGSLVECAAVALGAAVAFQGRLSGEYSLITVLAFQMIEGHVRVTAARAELPQHAAWFKRHSWVHAWWAPLAGWARLLCVVASAAGRVN